MNMNYDIALIWPILIHNFLLVRFLLYSTWDANSYNPQSKWLEKSKE